MKIKAGIRQTALKQLGYAVSYCRNFCFCESVFWISL